MNPTERNERPNRITNEYSAYAVTAEEIYDIIEMETDELRQSTTDDLHSSWQVYTELLSIPPTPPAVYRRMDHYQRPDMYNEDHTESNVNEANISDANEEHSEGIKSTNAVEPHAQCVPGCDSIAENLIYEEADVYRNIEPITNATDVCRNLEPITNDALDENAIDSITSSNDMWASYTNVNYKTSQLPLNLRQGSPTETPGNAKEHPHVDPVILNADCVTKDVCTVPKSQVRTV